MVIVSNKVDMALCCGFSMALPARFLRFRVLAGCIRYERSFINIYTEVELMISASNCALAADAEAGVPQGSCSDGNMTDGFHIAQV